MVDSGGKAPDDLARAESLLQQQREQGSGSPSAGGTGGHVPAYRLLHLDCDGILQPHIKTEGAVVLVCSECGIAWKTGVSFEQDKDVVPKPRVKRSMQTGV